MITNFTPKAVYIRNMKTGEMHELGTVKEMTVDEDEDEKIMVLQNELIGSLTMQIDEGSPFIKEIQNQHKKYLRDKAQYKFWKDQEFIGNNRAGRRRK